LGVLLGVLALFLLYVGVVVFPEPWFSHSTTLGGFRVYSDEPLPPNLDELIDDVDRRVAAMDHKASGASPRIFLCHDPERYARFAFLLRKGPSSLAIGVSLADEMFINMSRVRRFAELNRGTIRHSRFEGNLAEVIAHEIAHFHSLHALGYRAHLAQPMWKSEGWAEYQANLAAIRADPDYDLRERIARLLDDGFWSSDHGTARGLWESQILVEYLGEVEGIALGDLVRTEVTSDAVRQRMLDWYREGEHPASSLTPAEGRTEPRPPDRRRGAPPGFTAASANP
jgi:hypothetical protein